MDNKKQEPVDVVIAFESFEASMSNIAKLMGSYFEELTKAGIPYELAGELVRDWHSTFWDNQIRKSLGME